MALLNALFNQKIDNLEQAFNSKDTTSDAMKENIQTCFELFFNGQTQTEDNCQRIPCLIINKLVKTMFCEYSASATDAEVDKVLQELNEVKKKVMQSTFLGGECLIKPIITATGFKFYPIRRDCFIPLGRDADGTITSVGTTETTIIDGRYYTLLEKRTAGELLTIETKLFMSDNKISLGKEIPLNSLFKYKDLIPLMTLPVDGLGLVQVRTPIQNCVDLTNDGVCIYSPAIGLIKNINRNEMQLNDEFDLGQSRIIVSKDMLKSVNGERQFYDKVFTGLEEDPENVGIQIFNPNLREGSYINRRNEYLKSIESLIGFRRGLLSNVEAVEKTATEITSTAGEYNLTILDIQDVWTKAIKETLILCQQLGRIYNNVSLNNLNLEELIISYGDGVLYNRSTVYVEMVEMVREGILKPEMLVAWYYDLPHTTDADIEAIRKNYMPEVKEENIENKVVINETPNLSEGNDKVES